MADTFFQRFEQLIAAHTGLQLRPREFDALRGTLAARMAALHLHDAEVYLQLLQAGTPDAECEWEQLVGRLTNNESYFLRDKGQMALLRDRILPELIERNRARRTLRLWSAGCSTGEEPYSLALLVDELLPRRGASSGPPWEVVILGTDIDEKALQKASQGIYSSWSFRTMDPAQQQRCFHRKGSGWQIAASSRSLVTFARCNLVSDPFPSISAGIYDMDLILCRNVFIYFTSEAVSIVLPKFARTLRDGGYLMTGHSETQGKIVEPLQSRIFPESVVYQRAGSTPKRAGIPVGAAQQAASALTARTVASTHSQAPAPAATRRAPMAARRFAAASAAPETPAAPVVPADHALAQAEALYAAGDYTAVLRTAPEADGERALVLRARSHANLGQYQEAIDCCERVRKNYPLASEPYELLASIAQEQGRNDDARLLLKKALYLAPESPLAYIELGALYRSEGDAARARKMHLAALDVLQKLPPERAVGSYGPPAQEWVAHLKQLLTEGE